MPQGRVRAFESNFFLGRRRRIKIIILPRSSVVKQVVRAAAGEEKFIGRLVSFEVENDRSKLAH
jgi:hypothetical protein